MYSDLRRNERKNTLASRCGRPSWRVKVSPLTQRLAGPGLLLRISFPKGSLALPIAHRPLSNGSRGSQTHLSRPLFRGWDVTPTAPYTLPMSRLSKSEWRWRRAETLYELEMVFREEGWSSEEFVYDDEQDLYRFPDGGSPSPRSTPTSGGCGRRAVLCSSSRGPSRLRPLKFHRVWPITI